MGDGTKIEWTEATWNPLRGCRRVSAGCEHCYAETTVHRFSGEGQPYEGLTVIGRRGPRWSGEVRLVPEHLADPLRWQRPRRVFVNSMSDLFFEPVPFEYIAAVFGVMAASPRHTFQVLTKRPERAAAFLAWLEGRAEYDARRDATLGHDEARGMILRRCAQDQGIAHRSLLASAIAPWPLRNVWLGVSVEDQPTADLRLTQLLALAASVRWASYEPALGPVDFAPYLRPRLPGSPDGARAAVGLDWIVVGGESGKGARLFDLDWCRTTIAAGRAAGVPVFAKQKGANATDLGVAVAFDHPKGGDWGEWPEALRVREYPASVSP